MGAWIETMCDYIGGFSAQSPPAWGRGLKQCVTILAVFLLKVAPRVGAWIETLSSESLDSHFDVAPRVGAWIETLTLLSMFSMVAVAPRVGAWIETSYSKG